MAIQIRHPSLRNMTPMFRELDGYLEVHRIGFALSDPDGFLFAANGRFIEQTGGLPLQTTPLPEILRILRQRWPFPSEQILGEWLRHPPLRHPGFWEGRVHQEKGPEKKGLDLFRIPLSISRKGMLYLFQPVHPGDPPGLIEHFRTLRKSFRLILLDFLDYAVLLPALHSSGSPDRCNSVLLSTSPRFQAGSAFLRVEPDGTDRLKDLSGPVLRSTSCLDNPPPPVVRRGYFSREDDSEPLLFHLPLFAESSFYGWARFPILENMSRKTLMRSKTAEARILSETLHQIRIDLAFAPLLEKDSDSGFYSERGIRQILQDLMAPDGTGESFALVALTLGSPAGEGPLVEILERFSRKTDMVGRLSCGEYVLVLMDATQGRAGKALNRLKEVLEVQSRKDYRIRLRLGMAIFPDTPATPIRMLRSAFQKTMTSVGEPGEATGESSLSLSGEIS